MSLTNTTGADENILIKNLCERVRNLLLIINVIDRRIFIASKGDAVEKLMVKPDAKKEIRYVLFEFVGYDDDDTEGDDDCPVCVLIYRVRVFYHFVNTRPNGSNSAREFADGVLALRKDFLESREVYSTEPESERVGKIESLKREGFAATGADELTGVTGHFINFILRLKHYGN